MKANFKTAWSLLIGALVSCATPDFYEASPDTANYALIDDDTHIEKHWEGKGGYKTVRIMSVDLESVSYFRKLVSPEMAEKLEETDGIDLDNAVPLVPGEHKLLVEACEEDYGVLETITMRPSKCAKTVIRLDAQPNGRYRLEASVSKSRDHADIWVVNLRDGTLAVEEVRIKGLYSN